MVTGPRRGPPSVNKWCGGFLEAREHCKDNCAVQIYTIDNTKHICSHKRKCELLPLLWPNNRTQSISWHSQASFPRQEPCPQKWSLTSPHTHNCTELIMFAQRVELPWNPVTQVAEILWTQHKDKRDNVSTVHCPLSCRSVYNCLYPVPSSLQQQHCSTGVILQPGQVAAVRPAVHSGLAYWHQQYPFVQNMHEKKWHYDDVLLKIDVEDIFHNDITPTNVGDCSVLCTIREAVCSSAWFRCPSHVLAAEWGWAERGHWSQVRESLRVAVITIELQTKVKRRFAKILQSRSSVLNVKALVGTLNQEKALVGAFSVIVKLRILFGDLRFKLYPGHLPLPRRLGAAAGRPRLPLLPLQRVRESHEERRRCPLQLPRRRLGRGDWLSG